MEKKRRLNITNKELNNWGILIVFICVVSVYSLSLNHEFTYDDTIMIVKQETPNSIGDILQYFKEQYYPQLPYYRPITKITFMLQKAVHGDNPAPFRVFNAVLIGMACVLVYVMLRLTKFNIPKLPALFASALFGLHPVVSSSIYPAWGRDSLLFGFFIIAAVYAFLRSGRIWYWLAVGFCALALFSKEASVILIGLFVLADILKLSADPPNKSIRRWINRYGIIVCLYIIYFAIRHQLFGGREFSITALNNPGLPFLTPVYALQASIAPFVEVVYEPRTWRVWLSIPRLIITGIVVLFVVITSVKQWHSVKTTTLFWIGWLLLCNLPTSNILEQETTFTERFLFPSILAVICIIAGITVNYWNQVRTRGFIIGLSSILVFICAALSINRSKYYENNLVFYSQWIKKNPDYYLPNHAMGIVLADLGRKEEAAEYYRKAIRMNPEWPDSYLNLGTIYLDQDKYDKARSYYLKYLELKPESAKAYYIMGVVLTKQEKFNDAITYYSRALTIEPSYAEAHHNMGVIYHMHGDIEEAIKHYQAALRIDPNKENTIQYLKMAREEMGNSN